MLQQTTSQAVIPYFERFLKAFPTIESLAAAPLEAVYVQWAGLGYYSRARNLHAAAKKLAALGAFPRSHKDLLDLPGFGPYTARSVASLSFGEDVGVLDGNVIRVLTRLDDLDIEWWKTPARRQLQVRADEWVQGVSSGEMNQSLMELGATICTPQSPSCLLCPLMKSCEARKNKTLTERPMKRPKREREIWIWNPAIVLKKNLLCLVRSEETPFLKKHWSLPGAALRSAKKPSSFDYRHTVTHHDIYVTIQRGDRKLLDGYQNIKWVKPSELAHHVPASLVQKAVQLAFADRHDNPDARRLRIPSPTDAQ